MYETLLSVPGMNETVKVDLRLPRKTVLYLVQVMEKGLAAPGLHGPDNGDLEQVAFDCLEKAGLADLYARLRQLAGA